MYVIVFALVDEMIVLYFNFTRDRYVRLQHTFTDYGPSRASEGRTRLSVQMVPDAMVDPDLRGLP